MPWMLDDQNSPPLQAVPFWALSYNRNSKGRHSSFAKAAEEFRLSDNPTITKTLAQLCLELARNLPAKTPKENLSPSEWLSAAGDEFIGFLIPRPKWMAHEKWLTYLNSAKKNDLGGAFFTPESGLKAIVESNGHPIVIWLTVLSLEMHWRHFELDQNLWNNIFSKSGSSKFAIPKTSIDFSILQIYFGVLPIEHDTDLVNQIKDSDIEYPTRWRNLLLALAAGKLSPSRTDAMLGNIYKVIGQSHQSSNIAVRQLRNSLQFRLSGLDNLKVWDRLALPLPAPINEIGNENKNRLPSSSVIIDTIELRNICGIHHIKLQLNTPIDNAGQWTVILGPNGIGKTTFLRSLALGLRDVKDPSIWPKGVFSGAWKRIGGESDSTVVDAEIKIKMHAGFEYSTVIRSDTTFVVTQSPVFDQPKLFPLFSYGCRRGSALGGASREVNLENAGGPEIATLFDDQADLIHAETWLLQLEADATKSVHSENIFIAVIEALKLLLCVSKIEILDRKVWISQTGHPRLHFSALSDGYLTSAGWFLDLLARWLELANSYGCLVEPDFMKTMRGLVLIDEIDLHLHPQWQIEIIQRTRRLLPQMSFVVTTHNPLTLVGAKADEVWILSMDDDQQVSALCGTETPMLLTSGQIYRRYFGIEDIYPNGLGQQLQRYSFLCGYALRDDAEENELMNIGVILLEAGIKPNWEIVAREFVHDESIAVKKIVRSVISKKVEE